MPPGSIIAEETLIEQHGTSRTPIREARESLLEIYPHQGTFVSSVSLKDIYEIYQIRLIIKSRILKFSRPNLDEQVLAKYRNFFVSLEPCEGTAAEWLRQDREMHSYCPLCCCYISRRSNNKIDKVA